MMAAPPKVGSSVRASGARGSRAGSPVLDRRALNRAYLQRQLLLHRHSMGAYDAVAHLIGLQGQAPKAPYVGLWTRLSGFDPQELSALLVDRRAVRIVLMRSTIHLVTADDCMLLRPLMQPAVERPFHTNWRPRMPGVDLDEVAAMGRRLVDEAPLTFGALGTALAAHWPDADPAALAQAVRARVPLVQVPPRGLWNRSGPIAHTSAENWLGRPLHPAPSADDSFLRYLAAYGPASVQDAQTWSGLTRLGEVAERLRHRLASFRDEDGRELFDLPEAPRPDRDTPAPVRFLPEYDNALLSHADRGRIMNKDDTARVFINNGRILGAVLVQGFVRGTWRIDRTKDTATVVVEPFARVSKRDSAAIVREGLALLGVAAAGAGTHDVRIDGATG